MSSVIRWFQVKLLLRNDKINKHMRKRQRKRLTYYRDCCISCGKVLFKLIKRCCSTQVCHNLKVFNFSIWRLYQRMEYLNKNQVYCIEAISTNSHTKINLSPTVMLHIQKFTFGKYDTKFRGHMHALKARHASFHKCPCWDYILLRMINL